jgi:hypothetical protein
MNRDGVVAGVGGGVAAVAPRRRSAFIDTPTVLTAVAWVAIWLLWPMNGAEKPRSRVQTAAGVGYLAGGPAAPWYVEPDWFARTTRPGFGMPDLTAAMDSAVPDKSMMDSPRFVQGGMDVERPGGGPMPETGVGAEHHVHWVSKPAFQTAIPSPPVVVTMSAELVACRFELPAFATNDVLMARAKPWQVVAHVDVGADGRSENVLIELGCEDPQVNATIVRWLDRGVAGKAGVPVSGRVTVNGTGSRR